ncbi:MAG TPA: hypothetical protein IGS17_12585 [Oscillatoriales cyanobacterium M59_W2019_021]|nr:hypothetical protein [Oscillatoriales cyanobacterium M4454_W2019_049]HIK51740.1 hypothetical protein [Oscillatoriales cyanobacterium M59_W2019_021]
MKRLDRITRMREGFGNPAWHCRNTLPVSRSLLSFAANFPDVSGFGAIARRIPFITLPPDRPPISRILVLLPGILSATFLASCAEISSTVGIPVHTTPISQIVKNPKVGDSVNVKGTVTQQAPFLESGAYQIQDKTGKIWVMRDLPLPNPGDLLTIKAIVRSESIPIGQQDFGEVYLEERKQLD